MKIRRKKLLAFTVALSMIASHSIVYENRQDICILEDPMELLRN